MLIDEILAQLKSVRRAGDRKWMACCCAHDDRKPSLSIREVEGGRVLLNCFSGCSYESIAAILGINQRQPRPAPRRAAPIRKAIEDKPPDLESLWNRWQRQTDAQHLDGFAMSIDVDTEALKSIGCAWNGRAWAFPMKDARGKMIGIRLRAENGSKWAVTGSRQGLFYPDLSEAKTLYLVEGPTDLAAALTLGLDAFARPACLGQEQLILDYARRANRLVIISDNDEPGLRGAARLQGMLPMMSCLFVPPAKDLREFVSFGGTKELIESSLRDLVWTRPKAKAA